MWAQHLTLTIEPDLWALLLSLSFAPSSKVQYLSSKIRPHTWAFHLSSISEPMIKAILYTSAHLSPAIEFGASSPSLSPFQLKLKWGKKRRTKILLWTKRPRNFFQKKNNLEIKTRLRGKIVARWKKNSNCFQTRQDTAGVCSIKLVSIPNQ